MSSSDPPLEYVESKTPVSDPDHHPQRLHRGALGLVDIATATMAKIGPAMSFYFGFSLIATTAGVASPLTIVAAAIAIALLGNTLAEFSVQRYLHTHVPWPIFTLAVVAGTLFLMVRGVHLSTRWAGLFFAFEMLMLLIVSVAVLIDHAGQLSLAPFSPGNLSSGWKVWVWASRWRSICSSAGRTRPRWPRRRTTRAATCPGPSSPASS